MGDMADYYLELMWNEDGSEEEDGDGPPITTKICRCCGTKGLHWEKIDARWRLFSEDRKLHNCTKVPLK